MLLNAKLWHDLLYEQCMFPVTWVCSSVCASTDKGLELLHSNSYRYELSQMLHVCAQVNQIPSTMISVWKAKGCGMRLSDWREDSLSESFQHKRDSLHAFRSVSNEQGPCGLVQLFVSTFQLRQYTIARLAVTSGSLCATDIIYLLLVFVTSPTAKGIDV